MLPSLNSFILRIIPISIVILAIAACKPQSKNGLSEGQSSIIGNKNGNQLLLEKLLAKLDGDIENPPPFHMPKAETVAIEVCIMADGLIPEAIIDMKRVISTEYSSRTGIHFIVFDMCSQEQIKGTKEALRVQFTKQNISCGINAKPEANVTSCTSLGYTDKLPNYQKAAVVIKVPNKEYSQWSKNEQDDLLSTYVSEFAHSIGYIHNHAKDDGPFTSKCRIEKGVKEELIVDKAASTVLVSTYDPQGNRSFCDEKIPELRPVYIDGINLIYSDIAEIKSNDEATYLEKFSIKYKGRNIKLRDINNLPEPMQQESIACKFKLRQTKYSLKIEEIEFTTSLACRWQSKRDNK